MHRPVALVVALAVLGTVAACGSTKPANSTSPPHRMAACSNSSGPKLVILTDTNANGWVASWQDWCTANNSETSIAAIKARVEVEQNAQKSQPVADIVECDSVAVAASNPGVYIWAEHPTPIPPHLNHLIAKFGGC